MKTKQELVDCAQRELDIREHVYPKWVREGKMTKTKANYEIDAMREIRNALQERAEEK